MSNINYSNGKFFLAADGEQPAPLLDCRNVRLNRSRVNSHQFAKDGNGVVFPLEETVTAATKKIFRNTLLSLAESVIFMRVVNELLRKPQIQNVLLIGQPSPFAEELAEILPKFNPANRLHRPEKVEVYLLAENRFDTVIFFAQRKPPIELLLAVKDWGKIYFLAPPNGAEEILTSRAKIFSLTEQAALFELELSPQLRREFRARTPAGQLAEKKSEITHVLEALPDAMKKYNTLTRKKKISCLDEYIAEVVRAERVLAEIFPMLHSDTIKLNFNMLKEFLIDLRLADDDKSKRLAVARMDQQYEILLHDWDNEH